MVKGEVVQVYGLMITCRIRHGVRFGDHERGCVQGISGIYWLGYKTKIGAVGC